MRNSLLLFLCLLLLLAACQSPLASPAPTALPATSTVADAYDDAPHGYSTGVPGAPAAMTLHENSAGFQSQFAMADQFTVSLTNVPAAPQGQVYQGWLVGDSSDPLNVGILSFTGDGKAMLTWTSPNGENLLARYRRFQVTLEPVPGVAAPTGKTVYAGELSVAGWETARRLFVQNLGEPATPLNTAFALGLDGQLNIAIQHIENAQNAAAINAHKEMRVHLEHVINIFEGAAGPRFKDYSGDGAAQNPGDGFGVRGYARAIGVLLGSSEAQAAAAAVDTQIDSLQDTCESIIALNDVEAAKRPIADLLASVELFKSNAFADLYKQAAMVIWFPVQPTP